MTNEEKWEEEFGEWASKHLTQIDDLYPHYEAVWKAARQKWQGEIEKLKMALEDIVNPIGRLKRLMKSGDVLDGRVAIQLSEDHNFLKTIARRALEAK